MRFRRLSFVAGWAAVALLAVAGFAAFGAPEATVEEIQVEAAAASLGHTSGAYAGLAFALLSDSGSEDAIQLDVVDSIADPDPSTFPVGGLGAAELDDGGDLDERAPTAWLSEVEVRALVSLYFAASDVNRAVRVAWCESRFDPDSVNLRTGGIGLFQHLPKYWADRASSAGFGGSDPTDPEASTAAAAWAVYQGGGWDVFACRG